MKAKKPAKPKPASKTEKVDRRLLTDNEHSRIVNYLAKKHGVKLP